MINHVTTKELMALLSGSVVVSVIDLLCASLFSSPPSLAHSSK